MVQLGFYFHMQQALGGSRIALTWPLLFAVCFMLVFSVVIALFKDIPDVKGDSQVSLCHVQAFTQPDAFVPYLYVSPCRLTCASLICPVHLYLIYKASAECYLLQCELGSFCLMVGYIPLSPVCRCSPSLCPRKCVVLLSMFDRVLCPCADKMVHVQY